MRTRFWAGVVPLLCLSLAGFIGCNHHNAPPPTDASTSQYVDQTPQPLVDNSAKPSNTIPEPSNISVPDNAPQTRDRYLLVGINAYPGCPLEGCINDTGNMRRYLLEVIKAQDAEIVVLTDEQATAANIKHWLLWLVQDARPGDKRLYHFSGHGAEFDGGGAGVVGSQPDGLNQVECTVDFDWTAPHMIQDWEFNGIFAKVPPGVFFCWVSDSCHSGDLSKVIPPRGVLSLKARSYPLAPPPAVQARLDAVRSSVRRGVYKPQALNISYLGGCDYNQTSADVRDSTGAYGAATHYFLDQQRAAPTSPFKANVLAARKTMRADQFDQVLQFEGLQVDRPFLK